MKSEIRETGEAEAMQIDEPVKMATPSTPTKSSSSTIPCSPAASAPASMLTVKQEELRDDNLHRHHHHHHHEKDVTIEEREGPPRKLTPRKSNMKKNITSSPGGRPRGASYDNSSSYGYPKSGRYPPPGRPYAPPPPPYGYDSHYRPPHHPHHYPPPQMPPMHPGQPGGYPYPPPPPSYHPYGSHGGYGAPPPSHMAYPPPPHSMPSGYPGPSDGSITSSKSKNSKSKLPRKKRAMDHHHHFSQQQHEPMDDHQQHHHHQHMGGRRHRRNFSSASTASTLSEGGLSLCSSAQEKDHNPLTRASPKRRRGHDSNPISVNTSFEEGHHRRNATDSAARFQKLSVNDSKRDDQTNIFLTLSTSPINTEDVESTPVSKNKKKKTLSLKKNDKNAIEAFMSRTRSMDSATEIEKIIDRDAETPTPPMNTSGRNVLTDEHLLNRHLRGQTFTPLNSSGDSPSNSNLNSSNNNSFSAIQPQLSWSIAGDAPSLGDLAEWEEDRQKRPASTTSIISAGSRAMALSPNSFTMWKEDDPNNQHRTMSRDESLRLSMLSPNSELDGAVGASPSGATTPLPFFFGEGGQGEERENAIRGTFSNISDKSGIKDYGSGDVSRHHHSYHQRVPENVHSIFVNRSGSKRSSNKSSRGGWGHPHVGRSDSGGRGMRMPPTPVYSDHDGFIRSPRGRDPPPESPYYPHYMGPPPPHMQDRVRNLRGRAPPHHAPMPLQVPPPISSHHSLTSPMGVPSKMWGVPHQSPHHMPPPMELNPSKRKCVPLKPPIPSKFQGDIDSVKGAVVPEFTSLVNYPAHMSQKQSVNLPEGMRCCVMCGSACPCSSGGKNKKCHPSSKKEAAALEKQNGFAIIPTQNKGLCTLCDVNVWVVCQSGLEIKWCKGCKNFRPWAAFGDKGLATKCLRCRERQREKYALQKEEKEKARIMAKNKAKVI